MRVSWEPTEIGKVSNGVRTRVLLDMNPILGGVETRGGFVAVTTNLAAGTVIKRVICHRIKDGSYEIVFVWQDSTNVCVGWCSSANWVAKACTITTLLTVAGSCDNVTITSNNNRLIFTLAGTGTYMLEGSCSSAVGAVAKWPRAQFEQYTDETTAGSFLRHDMSDSLDSGGYVLTPALKPTVWIELNLLCERLEFIYIDVGVVNAAAGTLQLDYWSGSAWVNIPITDGTATAGAPLAKDGKVTITTPVTIPYSSRRLQGGYIVRIVTSAATLDATTRIDKLTYFSGLTKLGRGSGEQYIKPLSLIHYDESEKSYKQRVASLDDNLGWEMSDGGSSPVGFSSADRLYVGFTEPFDGVYIGMGSVLNANSATVTVTYWTGAGWANGTIVLDGTISTKPLGCSGAITWEPMTGCIRSNFKQSTLVGDLYWVALKWSSNLTPTARMNQMYVCPQRLDAVNSYGHCWHGNDLVVWGEYKNDVKVRCLGSNLLEKWTLPWGSAGVDVIRRMYSIGESLLAEGTAGWFNIMVTATGVSAFGRYGIPRLTFAEGGAVTSRVIGTSGEYGGGVMFMTADGLRWVGLNRSVNVNETVGLFMKRGNWRINLASISTVSAAYDASRGITYYSGLSLVDGDGISQSVVLLYSELTGGIYSLWRTTGHTLGVLDISGANNTLIGWALNALVVYDETVNTDKGANISYSCVYDSLILDVFDKMTLEGFSASGEVYSGLLNALLDTDGGAIVTLDCQLLNGIKSFQLDQHINRVSVSLAGTGAAKLTGFALQIEE